MKLFFFNIITMKLFHCFYRRILPAKKFEMSSINNTRNEMFGIWKICKKLCGRKGYGATWL